ncbi:MAG TPA: CDP-alcohol phosphatidyltransferase family protein [Allosphingosinicella sp.]|nr:CDP-alcohol phosphatidyltransferase family protein [Allosphingosinicella sp.]
MGSEKSAPAAVAAFASAGEANRRIAGVAAAARAVRALAEAGANEVGLRIGDGAALAPATFEDIERLRGTTTVVVEPGEGPTISLPTSWEIVRATGKPGDGLVSRWLNRPISQRITVLVLEIPGARPVHLTIVNALLALALIPVLLLGGEAGLVLGGILFQSASVLDGVDGEMARATFRASPAGAALDSAVDAATNLLFIAGITAHLALRDGGAIGWIGGWALVVAVVGWLLIARRVRAAGAPFGLDLFKRSGRVRGAADLVYWIVQTLSGRDCYAFLFMVFIIAGVERAALIIFTSVATLWIVYVLGSLLPVPRVFRGAA